MLTQLECNIQEIQHPKITVESQITIPGMQNGC